MELKRLPVMIGETSDPKELSRKLEQLMRYTMELRNQLQETLDRVDAVLADHENRIEVLEP